MDPCRPYAGVAPIRQAIDAVMDATTPRTRQHSFTPSLSLSRATPTAETPLPLSPRAPRASHALIFVSHLTLERLQVRLELLHLLHPLVGRDLPEVSHILRVCHCQVHGRRDPDFGEPRRCSVLAFLLPSESHYSLLRSRLWSVPRHSSLGATVMREHGHRTAAPTADKHPAHEQTHRSH